MWLSDPQEVDGFGCPFYPHSSALRASNGGYNKSDLLTEVLINSSWKAKRKMRMLHEVPFSHICFKCAETLHKG